MSDPEIEGLVREARARRASEALGTCEHCESTESAGRTPGGIRCYEHLSGPEGRFELDHLAGIANLPGTTLAVRANAHRRATEIRRGLGSSRWPTAEGDPLLQAAHLVAGLVSYLWLIAEWLVALDSYLRQLGGVGWFADAPTFPFA